MCIATRCTSVEQFIQMFHRFVDEESFFVSTLNTRPPGLETSFSVQLADGTPVLRGLCVVLQAWTTPVNPFKTPGVRLGIKRLTANSMAVFEQLLVTRSAKQPPATPGPRPLATVVVAKPGTPKPIEKSPFSETAPARSVASRVVLETPARASSEPIPQHIAAESTDVTEERTNVREANPLSPAPRPLGAKPPIDLAKTLASIGKPAPTKPAAGKPAAIPPVIPPIAAANGAAERLAPPAIPPVAAASATADRAAPSVTPPVAAANAAVAPAVTSTVATANGAADRPSAPTAELAKAAELAKPVTTAEPMPDANRTPGSELVLPANPLMNLTDESLKGYVDCTLYEETGNFFPADDDTSFVDDVVAPPRRDGTPVPMRPGTAGFDSSPTTQISPPLAVGTSPALPAAPGENVLIEPGLVARTNDATRPSDPLLAVGDTPLPPPDPDLSAVSKLPLAPPRFESPPQGMPAAAVLAPTRRKRPPWLWLGGAGALVVTVTLVLVLTSSSDGSTQSPPTPAATKPVAQVAPPVAAVKPEPAVTAPTANEPDESDEADEPDESDEPPSSDGAPVVGSGPCKVVVHTTPAASKIKLDGARIGPSPLTIAAPCGKHQLEISHPRYAAQSKLVTLTENEPATVDVTLSRPTHNVTLTSNPAGATVFINGRSAGTTPTKVNVLGFVTLKLDFKKTGYQPVSTKLYSKAARDKVSVRLKRW